MDRLSDDGEALPTLWLCGAPGAGKSVTGWALFELLRGEGVATAYLDVDQLGMLYPADVTDPDRYALKTEAVNAVLSRLVATHAQALVISGVIAPGSPADTPDEYPAADMRFCLLDPAPEALRARILTRGRDDGDADEVMAHADALRDAEFPRSRIDTSVQSVAEVAKAIRGMVRPRPRRDLASARPTVPPSRGTAGVVVLTGPRAVGTSTIGFGLARSAWDHGTKTGFLDLDQLSFVHDPFSGSHLDTRLGLGNVAALHDLFTAKGARRLIVSSHVTHESDVQLLRDAVSAAPVTVVRLTADRATLESHVRQRATGGLRLAGDDLTGADAPHRARIVDEAVAQQQELDSHLEFDLLVDVSNRTPESVVDEIHRRLE